MKTNQKGFTLIELLVVIAIIGMLSTMSVVALNSARMKARDARRVSDIKQVQTALELFYNDQGYYAPVGSAATAGSVTAAGDQTVTFGVGNGVCLDNTGFRDSANCTGATIYMAQIPQYPSPRTDGSCTDVNSGYDYTFNPGTDQSNYTIDYCLGAKTGGIDAGPQTACPSGISGC